MAEYEFPYPAGMIVRCIHRRDQVPLRPQCIDHIWQVVADARPAPEEGWGSGFTQAAKCLVCEYHTQAIDADFFYQRANVGDLLRSQNLAREEYDRLGGVLDRLAGLAAVFDGNPEMRLQGEEPVGAMRNFD